MAMEEYVRNIPTLSALSAFGATLAATLVLAGCGSNGRSTAEGMTADLERDLQLASAVRPARTQAVSAVELEANGAPSGNSRGQRATVRRPRRAPVESPSVTTEEVAAPAVAAEEPAPILSPTMTESAPAPAPAPVIEPIATNEGHGPYIGTSAGTYGTDDGDRGRGDNGRGRGGVIIRGGSAGDDHCEPRGPRGARRPNIGMGGGGIGGNIGNVGTIIGIIGGARRSPYPRY